MNNDAHLPDDLPPAAVEGSHCSQHPYRPNLGGGICASCLKEKLGKLVSSSSGSSSSSTTTSSFPLPLHRPPSSSSASASSSPPSSDMSSSSKPPNLVYDRGHSRRAKIPSFLYSKKKKNRKHPSPAPAVRDRAAELALRRSNTAPKRPEHLGGFLDGDILEYSPRKKGFWSFLYLSAGNHSSSSASSQRHGAHNNNATSSSSTSAMRTERTMPFSDAVSKRCSEVIPEEDNVNGVTCDGNNFERKVSRSRSVGCGSRSFSGDFFERISTGFGDCTFLRLESQRETNGHTRYRVSSADPDSRLKQRVRCGRIFGGFMLASSSSSLSSSSYWISASSSEGHDRRGEKWVRSAVPAADALHGRSWRWSWGGWVFASPMRAFGRPSSSKDVKSCNATPNLNAIPSLLTVGV